MESVSRLCLVADARRRENDATAKKFLRNYCNVGALDRLRLGFITPPSLRLSSPADLRSREGFAEMLRETRGALFASDSADADASFEATAAIAPRACRPVPPRSNAKTAVDAPADLPAKAVGFAAALAFGRAFPPAPPTEDGLTAPAAWHPSRPILATVDGEGQLLIHHDPARESLGTPAGARRAPAASATALRHASHPRARARRGARARGRDSRRRRGGRRVPVVAGPRRVRRRRRRDAGERGFRRTETPRARLAAVAHPPPSRRLRRRAARRGAGPVPTRRRLHWARERRARGFRNRTRGGGGAGAAPPRGAGDGDAFLRASREVRKRVFSLGPVGPVGRRAPPVRHRGVVPRRAPARGRVPRPQRRRGVGGGHRETRRRRLRRARRRVPELFKLRRVRLRRARARRVHGVGDGGLALGVLGHGGARGHRRRVGASRGIRAG